MSRRFGRNQRRKLVDHVARLQALHQEDQQREAQLANVIQAQAQSLGLVSEILGPHFVGLPVCSRQVDGIRDVLHLPRSLRPAARMYPREVSQVANLSDRLIELETISLLRPTLDELRDTVHIRVHTLRGDCAYALSAQAMRAMPRGELISKIAGELAEHLANELLAVTRQSGGRRER